MSNAFTDAMLRFFRAERGAYSRVTKNEFDKYQITLTGAEQELAEDFLGADLENRHGNKEDIAAKGIDPELEYRLHPFGEKVFLTTSYKTNKPRELRLYLKNGHFRPDPGRYWGVFEREGRLWLCDISPDMLGKINSNVLDVDNRSMNLEPEEDDFQSDLNEFPAPEKKKSELYRYERNRKFSLEALNAANFNCELFPEFPTFRSLTSGKNFMEAHHLIPMKLQASFEVALDVPANICCLNPLSHRMVHYGQFEAFEDRLASVVKARSDFIRSIGWIEDDVLALYAI